MGHYASEHLGGEGILPLQYYRRLRSRGIEAWLLTHDSARAELAELLGPDIDRVLYAPSLRGLRWLWPFGERLPDGMRAVAWALTQIERQIAMLPMARAAVRDHEVNVVHQPIGISPVVPSALQRLGAAVVMGPLQGGMDLPPEFRGRDGVVNRMRKAARPIVSEIANRLLPGRLHADVVLVANQRTAKLLPRGIQQPVATQWEAGVVLDSWTVSPEAGAGPTRFLFLGRLVPLKGVDLLLEAFASVTERVDAVLEIAGDGPQRLELQGQIATLGLGERVELSGWLDRAQIREHLAASTVFVFPSIHEAGGTVVLEAMASGRPVIAADWGGPADVLDESCGILVDVSARGRFVDGLAAAMIRLAEDPALRRRLGAAGRERIEKEYDWDVLVDRMLDHYARARRIRPEEPHVTPSDPARDAYDGWPSVSAVVCTRDRPELLRKAIAAILGQDYEGRIECSRRVRQERA